MTCLFYFYVCTLSGKIFPAEDLPRASCRSEGRFYYFQMFWCFPWKDSCLHARRFLYSWVLFRLMKGLNEMPWTHHTLRRPASGELTPTRTSLTTYTRHRSTTPVFFNLNFLMEPGWPASLGRFQLNLGHYLRSRAVKTVASRHKCDDTLPLQENRFQLLLGFSLIFFPFQFWGVTQSDHHP